MTLIFNFLILLIYLQPRLLTTSAFVMGLGSFIMTIPHFATDKYVLGAKEAEICESIGKRL